MSRLTESLELLRKACDADPDDARRRAREALFKLPDSDETPTPDGLETVRQRLETALEASNDPIRPVRAAYIKLKAVRKAELTVKRRVEVPVPEETWDEIVEQAREESKRRDARSAFWDVYTQYVHLDHTIVVGGEVKGPEDVFDELEPDDTQGEGDDNDDDDDDSRRGSNRVFRGP